jgi:hypothetical protein
MTEEWRTVSVSPLAPGMRVRIDHEDGGQTFYLAVALLLQEHTQDGDRRVVVGVLNTGNGEIEAVETCGDESALGVLGRFDTTEWGCPG